MPDIFSAEVPELLLTHLEQLTKQSGIAIEVVQERRYRSILGKKELEQLGFTKAQRRTPGLLIPLWGVDGQQIGYTYRSDNPRSDSRGKVIKYENVPGSSLRLDCPPRCKDMLGDPSIPLWVTEGIKKGDALASHGLCVIVLSGVWGFKGKNRVGGVTLLADWDQIALNGRKVYIVFDSDIMIKPEVQMALHRLTEHLHRKGAEVLHVILPSDGGEKMGVDKYLLGRTVEDLVGLALKAPEEVTPPSMQDVLTGFTQDIEAGRREPEKVVSMLRDLDTVSLHIRRTLVSRLVITVLSKSGRLIKNSGGRFYFHTTTKQLLKLDSFEFGVLLNDIFGLNQTEPEFRFTLADLNTEAHLRGQPTQVHRFTFYDRQNNILYVDSFDGRVYRLDGQKIQLVDNGSDGVLFTKQPTWEPYRYVETGYVDGLLNEILVDDIPFQRDSFAPLTPDQQRIVFSLWVFAMFFESLLPTKPILAIVGEKGPGKTTALRRVLRLLFGSRADVIGLEREREDAFAADRGTSYLDITGLVTKK